MALLLNSIFSRTDSPSFDRFMTGIFFLFTALGLSAGIAAGAIYHSLIIGLLLGALGLFAGYLLGILAGLWLQYLGWLASIVSGCAGLFALGIFLVYLVLLAGHLLGS